tara:strand:+ start:1166 stop:1654 length:489 start_codon:yes stop_codon:yes gene_type:complete
VIDLFFLALAAIICVPGAQLLLDLIESKTDASIKMTMYEWSEILDWMRDPDDVGPAFIGTMFLGLQLTLFVVSPVSQAVFTSTLAILVLLRIKKVRDQLDNLEKIISLGKTRCDKHPEIIKALCLEPSGDLKQVCPLCNPELAEDFGVTVKDCTTEENNKDN